MRWLLVVGLLWAFSAVAQDVPEWFTESFLDIREDAAEAAKDGKRLMLYFMQDGCPYCKQLVTVNWREPRIVEKTRRHFMAVAINIFGDREVTASDGRKLPEKRYAALLKVQFTPTLVFFDEKGMLAHRINGYLPPDEFFAALDQAIGKSASAAAAPARPLDVRRKAGARPVALFLASADCAACAELDAALKSGELKDLAARFEWLRGPNPAAVRTANGVQTLHAGYVPAMIFFSESREVFRTEAYLRPFHLASALDYVASGGYAREPSFQRFLHARAERLRSRGERVDLWN